MTDENLVRILDGNTFVVSRDTGDIDADPSMPTGFFSYDTRFLSKWQLRINGESLHPLSVDDVQYFETRFFLVPGSPSHYVDAKVSVIRQRMIGTSFDEQLTVFNHSDQPMELTIRMDAGNDFADLFEIKNVEQKAGRPYVNVEDGKLRLGYERQAFRRETVITSSEPAEIDENGFTFTVRIEPQQQWSTNFHVQAVVYGIPGGDPSVTAPGRAVGSARREMKAELDRWLEQAPRLETDNKALQTTYRRSLVDLAALRFTPRPQPGRRCRRPACPGSWRSSAATACSPASRRCRSRPSWRRPRCARWPAAGHRVDDFRDEEPGKILHELRLRRADRVRGAAALALLRRRRRHHAVPDPARRVRALDRRHGPGARAGAGGARGAGLDRRLRRPRRRRLRRVPAAQRRDRASTTSAGRTPGTRSPSRTARSRRLPRATCELQGYVYDAKMRSARLAREVWGDPGSRDRWSSEAAELKERFNRDFWIADAQLLRAGARRAEAQGRLAHLEHRPPAVERHRPTRTRRKPSSST